MARPPTASFSHHLFDLFVRLSAHLLAKGGKLYAMKGVYPVEEIAQLKSAKGEEVIALTVPGLEAQRHLVIIGVEE